MYKEKGVGMRLFWLAIWWLWIPAVIFVTWAFAAFVTPGIGDWRRDIELGIQLQLLPNGLDLTAATPWFWIMMFIGCLGSVGIIAAVDEETPGRRGSVIDRGICLGLVITALASAVFSWNGFWDNDKDEARYYNGSTVFYSPTLDLNKAPSSLNEMLKGATPSNNKDCTLVSRHDMPSCIKEGSLPDNNWEARTSSLAGAQYYLGKKTGDKSGVNLMPETVTYLYNKDTVGGKWSGIRDGSEKRNPLYGVVEWNGQGDPTECFFNRNDYNINRAFNGTYSNSLVNLISERYRQYFWDNNDMWGYCDGDKPVIVIPMKREISYNVRTVETAAGVLIMRGSQSGDPSFDFHENIKEGELPGPVYPASLVTKQRNMLEWAAGRGLKNANYGYEATDADAQTGNSSEYLLRDKDTKRLYWVSPMTPRGDSQLFVAYARTPADTMSNGNLNTFSTYVLDDNDPRQVNLDTLDNTVKQVVGSQDPAFVSSGGRIVEYLPLDNTTWQVYAERGGQPVYVITIPRDEAISKPTIGRILDNGTVLPSQAVTVGGSNTGQPNQTTPPQGGSQVGCDKPVDTMSEPELASCMGKFADEYRRRHPN